MRTKMHDIIVAIAVLGALAVLGGAAGAVPTATHSAQTDTQGGIVVKAVYITAAYLKASPRDLLAGKVDAEHNIIFAVTPDTHEGDLGTYDFPKNVQLRNDRGQQVTPVRWLSTADGAHHLAGVLLFPKSDQAGRAIDAQVKTLVLIVRSPALPNACCGGRFRWNESAHLPFTINSWRIHDNCVPRSHHEGWKQTYDVGEEQAMMGGFGGIGMLLWVGVIVAIAWWIAQAVGVRAPQSASPARTSGTPRETLDARLARGHITLDQYHELRKELE